MERIVINVDTLYREFSGTTEAANPITLFAFMAELKKDKRGLTIHNFHRETFKLSRGVYKLFLEHSQINALIYWLNSGVSANCSGDLIRFSLYT